MNISRLFVVFASILAIVMVAGFASAACENVGDVTVCTTSTIPASSVAGTNIPLNINITYSGIGTNVPLNFTGSSISAASWNLPSSNLAINGSQTITRTITIIGTSAGSSVDAVLRVNVDGNDQVSLVIPTISITSQPIVFCPAGSSSTNLSIEKVRIDNNGDGNDDEWELLDEIEIEVEVKNVGANDLDNIIVEMGLYNGNSNDVTDLDFSDADEEQQDLGDLDEGEREEITFSFRVPADMEDGDYQLVFKAYPDDDESLVCTQKVEGNVDIQRESDRGKAVIVDDIEFPIQATCGEMVTGTFSVFNIGDDKEDQILVRLINNQLGLNEEIIVRDNLDGGEEEPLEHTFTIPQNIPNARYTLTFTTEYDYDDRNDEYDEKSEDDFTAAIQIIGCGTPTPTPTDSLAITADVEEATPGQVFDVRVTFRNRGTESVDLELDASGFQSWGELDRISDDSFSLDAGESKTITFSFNADETASGAQSFTVQARSANGVETQEVDVEFPETESSSGFSLSGNKPLLWIIGAINVVLIVLIIVVAIRLARK